VRELWRRIDALLRRRSLERDLDEELSFHLDMKEREIGNRAAATRALGSALLVRERARDAWGWRWVDEMLWDVRYALRVFRQNPGFTAAAVAMLALGIGVNATVFTLSNTILFKGFPYIDRNDRILYIHTSVPGRPEVPDGYSSYADVQDWRAQAKSFGGLAFVTGSRMSLSDGRGFPENCSGSQVSANTFQLLGQRPVLGRDFAPSDETPGAAPVAILSYGLWARRYGNDPTLVGQTVRIDGAPTIVIGVMAPGFSFPYDEVLWIPRVITPDLQKREARVLWLVFGRLADGITIKRARAEMDTIGRRLASAYPGTNQDFLPVVQTYNEHWVGPKATMIYESIWGAVGCLLLIACVNLANLLLARAMNRSREMSVRIALGAGRWRIIRQLLIESVMLSTMGGLFGWWMTKWGVGVRTYELAAFSAFPIGAPSWFDFTMDYRVLGYLIAISLGTGVLFGLAPALRLSKFDINTALKDGGRGSTGGGRGMRLSSLLVIGEMALAVVLLTAAGVMIRSFLNIYTADVGVSTENVLTASVALPVDRYSSAEAQSAFFDRLTTRLDAIPGVESVALADALPTFGTSHFPYELSGAPPVDEHRRPRLAALVISPAYFRTLRATVLAGRAFNDGDGVTGVPVVIVNQRLASTLWPGEDPLGKRLRLFKGTTPDGWRTVVGIVSNIVQNDSTRQASEAVVYVPYRQKPAAGMNVIARTQVPPASLGAAVRRQIQAIDADLPVRDPSTLAERMNVGFNYRFNGSMAVLFLIFAAIALLLASVGLYAVIAHSVTQRTQEIGIRMAIGATARDVLTLVARQGLLPLGIGLTIGLAASLAVTPIFRSALVRVSPADPISMLVGSAVLIVSGTLGCLIPARRAMRVDPVVALRSQ
jgi:putative ABC transport system permease protein